MEIKLDRKFTGPEGNVITTEAGEEITLQDVLTRSMLGDYPDETRLSGDEKYTRYQLGMKLNAAKDSIELTIEQLALCKSMVAKMYGVLVSGQSWDMLEHGVVDTGAVINPRMPRNPMSTGV